MAEDCKPAQKDFHIADILSVTHGLMLSPSRFNGIAKLLHYLTGHALGAHQLARAVEEVREALLDQLPSDIRLTTREALTIKCDEIREENHGLEDMIAWLEDTYGQMISVRPVPESYEYKSFEQEAAEKFGPNPKLWPGLKIPYEREIGELHGGSNV